METWFTPQTLQDIESSQILGVGKVLGGLYILDHQSFNQNVLASFTSSSDLIVTFPDHCDLVNNVFSWHHHLGHPSSVVTKLLPLLLPVTTLHSPDVPCDVCHFSKQCKLHFHLSTIKSTSSFQLIHMDLWGPYK
ncbi:hypothetical protein Scep_001350 [Stephania cephalantha]|uniref:GAG-pre-integrase domain-containing protein n=1 Tax=Stephania cephalantha TaxID=152367 RepID=A0AAP0LBL2_9MAGN